MFSLSLCSVCSSIERIQSFNFWVELLLQPIWMPVLLVFISSICRCTIVFIVYYHLYHSICVELLALCRHFVCTKFFGFSSRFLPVCVKSISLLSLQQGVIITHAHRFIHNCIRLFMESKNYNALCYFNVEHSRYASDNHILHLKNHQQWHSSVAIGSQIDQP